MVDIVGWLTLGGFFSANITGDLVEAVSHLAPGHPPHALQLLAVPLFFVGVVLVYAVARWMGSASVATVRGLLLAQALLLACASVINVATGTALSPGGPRYVAIGVIAVVAIGLSNTTMHLLDS